MEGIRLAMHETLASDEGRALYAARRELAEPVFGQTKVTRRADRFLRRGLDACQSEWRLICAPSSARSRAIRDSRRLDCAWLLGSGPSGLEIV